MFRIAYLGEDKIVPGVRDGRGNDTLFPQAVTDAFKRAVYPPRPTDGGGATPTPTTPGQVVQPKVLVAEWRLDSPGTVDINTSLGIPVITAWRDTLGVYTLAAPSLTQAPFFLATTDQVNALPAASFDGIDDYLECLTLGPKFNNLTGVSVSLWARVFDPGTNNISRIVWLESGVAGVPRFAYSRTGIGSFDFQVEGATRDTDTVAPAINGVYPGDAWAAHVARRDYLLGTARVDYAGAQIDSATGIQTMNYGDSSTPLQFRIGAQDRGQYPAGMHLYGFRVYSYAITDDTALTDAQYYEGLAG